MLLIGYEVKRWQLDACTLEHGKGSQKVGDTVSAIKNIDIALLQKYFARYVFRDDIKFITNITYLFCRRILREQTSLLVLNDDSPIDVSPKYKIVLSERQPFSS